LRQLAANHARAANDQDFHVCLAYARLTPGQKAYNAALPVAAIECHRW
jgi:hypothetical protein